MMTLTRGVRFAVSDGPDADGGPNGYAGAPSMRGLGRHYEVQVVCEGMPDARTAYLIDIKDVDRAVREVVMPTISETCRHTPSIEPGAVLPGVVARLDSALGGRLRSLRWRLSPYYSVEMHKHAPGTVLLRQKFDFAASHRLHAPGLSAEENRRLYGKCNNPSGHGHNYQVEPTVAVSLDSRGRQAFTLADLERVTDETIVRRFDHKHLNVDCPEFAASGGVNPSVENITRVFHDLLASAIRRFPGAELRSITVWETDRTSCTYPA